MRADMQRRAALLLAALVALAACGSGNRGAGDSTRADEPPSMEPVPVAVDEVGTSEGLAPVVAVGTFSSRDEIPLAFKIGGVVQRVQADQGDMVKRGQVLATLDLREIDAALAKAQAMVDKTTRDYERLRRLVADSVATPVQLQDAATALDAARADLTAARVNREYATITAPESGTVLQRLGAPGATVGPGTPIFLLGGASRGRVLRVGLPDRDALRVQQGDSATVTFDAVPNTRYAARVVLVSRAADPRTGTYAVELALRGAEQLPHGLVGQAVIHARNRADNGSTSAPNATTLPIDALLEANGDSATIYLVETRGAALSGTVAVRQRVAVTGIEGDRVHVQGVPADARVITRGASYVMPDAPVRIVTAAMLDSLVGAGTVAPRGNAP